MPYALVEGLRETDFGRFEGKNADELSSDPAYQAWVDAMCLTPIPGGEAAADFKKRCCKAFAETIAAVPDGMCAAFVVHGGVIMAVLEFFAYPKRDFYAIISETESALPARMTGRRCVSKSLRAETRSVRIITGSTTPAACPLDLRYSLRKCASGFPRRSPCRRRGNRGSCTSRLSTLIASRQDFSAIFPVS